MSCVFIINGTTILLKDDRNKYHKIGIEIETLKECMVDSILTLLYKNRECNMFISSYNIIELALKYYAGANSFFVGKYDGDLPPIMKRFCDLLKSLPEYKKLLWNFPRNISVCDNRLLINIKFPPSYTYDKEVISYDVLIDEDFLKGCMQDAIYTLLEKTIAPSPNSIIKLALKIYCKAFSVTIINSDKLFLCFLKILNELESYKNILNNVRTKSLVFKDKKFCIKTTYPGHFGINSTYEEILFDPIEIRSCIIDSIIALMPEGHRALNSGNIISHALKLYTGVYSFTFPQNTVPVLEKLRDMVNEEFIPIYKKLGTPISESKIRQKAINDYPAVRPKDIIGYAISKKF